MILGLPEQSAHEADDCVTGASTQSHRPERRQAHDSYSVHRAGMTDHRPATNPERQVREADDEVPGLGQEPLPRRADEGGVVGRWVDEGIHHRWHPPSDGGHQHTQLCAQVLGEISRYLGGRTRSRDESDHHLTGTHGQPAWLHEWVRTLYVMHTSVGSPAE